MSGSSFNPPFILHATPSIGDLPASDPQSIYYVALLQAVVPGRWAIKEGDYGSNNGKLPYITHLNRIINPRHLNSLPSWTDIDEDLNEDQRSDNLIWKTYIEGTLTDIINYNFYSLPPNYPSLVAPSQTKNLGSLEKHYIPQRIRSIHKSRLEHIGLWGLGGLNEGDSVEEDKQKLEESFIVAPGGTKAPRQWTGWRSGVEVEKRRKLWGEEEFTTRLKRILDPIVRRLDDGPYFFETRLSTLDLLLFSYLSIILIPSYPNPLIPNIIKNQYPSLVSFHNRLSTKLSLSDWETIHRVPTDPPPSLTSSVYNTISSWTNSQKRNLSRSGEGVRGNERENMEEKRRNEQEKKFERGRWIWFAAAGISMIGYLFVSGLVRIEYGSSDSSGTSDFEGDDNEDEEDEGDGEVGNGYDSEEGDDDDDGDEVTEEIEIVVVEGEES